MAEAEYKTLSEFWPFYLGEHAHPVNRWLHAVGSLCGLGWLGTAIATRNPWLALAAPITGYAFAWIGHFVVEKNRPATFKYPLKSFLCDWRLLYVTLTFQAAAEVEALRAAGRLPAAKAAAEPAGAAR
jgi:hypothetical protein